MYAFLRDTRKEMSDLCRIRGFLDFPHEWLRWVGSGGEKPVDGEAGKRVEMLCRDWWFFFMLFIFLDALGGADNSGWESLVRV